MKSRLYEGLLRHRRVSPKQHAFQYRVFMPYLCLEELPALFADKRFWSATGSAVAQFRRSDFLGDPAAFRRPDIARTGRARVHQ